jgi:two-component system sensor histidine kinase KdpD
VGLGLALCRAIIEAHGGSMKAVNKNSNSGAAFIMDLPLREPPLLNLDELGGSSL